MTLLDDRDERFKHLFGKTALFILLAVLGIGLAVLFTGIKKGAFTAKSPVYFVADSGQDLSVGMPVKFSGFKVGKLNTLTLDEQGHVQVEIIIETKYLKLIRQDAMLSLKKEGVIGDGVLEVSRGSEELPVLQAGNKLRFERANGLEQAVLDMKNRIVPILDDVHDMLHDPNGDVRQTLRNLRQITAEIKGFSAEMHGTRERIDQVLGSVDGTLNNEVTPLLKSLRQSAVNAESMSAKLDHELPTMLKKVDSSMESLRITSEAIQSAMQGTAPQLPGVMGEARDTLGKTREILGTTQDVVDSLSTRWPLKTAIPVPETGAVRMDSHD